MKKVITTIIASLLLTNTVFADEIKDTQNLFDSNNSIIEENLEKNVSIPTGLESDNLAEEPVNYISDKENPVESKGFATAVFTEESEFALMEDSYEYEYFSEFLDDNDLITRGEMAIMLTQLFNYSSKSINYFNDLDDEYYTDPLLKLAAADIMVGDGNMIRPNDNVTFEELCSVIYKILKVDEANDIYLDSYFENVSPWATDILNSLIVGGYLDTEKYNVYDVKEKINFQDFKSIIAYALPYYYENSSEVIDKSTNNNILVVVNDVTFENASLNNIYVTCNVNIDTLNFINSTYNNLIVIEDGDNLHSDEIYDFELSTFSTTFDKTDENRNTNLQLSMAGIDNVILMSGEEFSFNQTLGERTYDKGYKDATIVYANTYSTGIAGGICQTSTTLYNAVVESGLDINERWSHTLKVPYVEPGMDAMVNYGTNDLKFSNNYDAPVIINTEYVNSGEIKITILSQGFIDVPEVETVVEGGPQNYTTYIYENDAVKLITNSWYYK